MLGEFHEEEISLDGSEGWEEFDYFDEEATIEENIFLGPQTPKEKQGVPKEVKEVESSYDLLEYWTTYPCKEENVFGDNRVPKFTTT